MGAVRMKAESNPDDPPLYWLQKYKRYMKRRLKNERR
jgi:hypothetical protein